jgi:hypothetical protein
MFSSGKHTAIAADTAEPLEVRNSAGVGGSPFAFGYLSLDPAASGPARFGGSNVKVSTGLGALLSPGDTIPIYSTGAAEPHHTADTYIAFSNIGDIVGWTLHR